MELSNLSNDQIVNLLEEKFAFERKNSRDILLLLREISVRRIYAEMGYSSIFWMLIKYYHQSETAAYQRLKTLDLMLVVPVVEERLISGDLNMTTVAMAQRQITQEEKLTGADLSFEKKAEIVESITNKTQAQAKIELFKYLLETASQPKTVKRRVSEDATRVSYTMPDDVMEMIDQLKNIWARVDSTMDDVEVLRRALTIALDKVDPTRKKKTQRATETAKHCSNERLTYYGTEFDRVLWERAGSQCEYKDEKSGRRCESKHGLQREHVIPIAMGGTNELSNMQLLCRPHNDLRARKRFGNAKIDRYQKKPEHPS